MSALRTEIPFAGQASGDAAPGFVTSTEAQPGFKAIFDLVMALVLAIPALPLIGLAMLAVRLSSRGPTLYSQERVGLRGKVFRIYKIRTMIHDCEVQSGPRWATTGDPRVTSVGRFLRRTHLDELPQLWNVIRGEMSLVGPRPERPIFVSQLSMAFEDYDDRHLVRPGVTGLAQVQLPPDTCLNSVRDKLAYDLFYVNRGGPWLDMRILVATFLKVVGVPFRWTRVLLALPTIDELQKNRSNLTISSSSGDFRGEIRLV